MSRQHMNDIELCSELLGEGVWRSKMRSLLSRLSRWVLFHPAQWAVGWGVVLALLGFVLNLEPILVVAVGAALGALNILHAKKRGYCPRLSKLGPRR